MRFREFRPELDLDVYADREGFVRTQAICEAAGVCEDSRGRSERGADYRRLKLMSDQAQANLGNVATEPGADGGHQSARGRPNRRCLHNRYSPHLGDVTLPPVETEFTNGIERNNTLRRLCAVT